MFSFCAVLFVLSLVHSALQEVLQTHGVCYVLPPKTSVITVCLQRIPPKAALFALKKYVCFLRSGVDM